MYQTLLLNSRITPDQTPWDLIGSSDLIIDNIPSLLIGSELILLSVLLGKTGSVLVFFKGTLNY